MERMLLRTFSFCLLLLLLQRVSSGGQRTRGGSVVAPRGRFSTTDHMQCTWTANDAGEPVTLRVRCRTPQARVLRCSYRGAPRSCAAFRSEPRRFWKQVGRALTKLRARLCHEGASVRAGVCRRAPGDAHFELDADSVFLARTPAAPAPPPSPTSTSCTGRADHRSTAEEYCSAWASVCSFLLSMMQSDAC